jgi:hypothetical protein
MVGLSGNDAGFGIWLPLGQSLPEELTIRGVNPIETILNVEVDFTFPGNESPPQVLAPFNPLIPGHLSFENDVPSPTPQDIGFRLYVGIIFFHPETDIRANRAISVRPFACAGKCGNSEW